MNYKHGKSKTPLYAVWNTMRSRCSNPNAVGWKDYGARGITVCDRWMNSFEAFMADMGERPPGASLERVDNSKGYCPENVVWATKEQQDANKRSNRIVRYAGEDVPLFVVAKKSGVPFSRLFARLKLGYSADEAADPNFDSFAKSKAKAREKAAARTHCVNGHELTPENTFLYSAARPVKCCKTCRRENRLRRLGRYPQKPGWVEVTITPQGAE